METPLLPSNLLAEDLPSYNRLTLPSPELIHRYRPFGLARPQNPVRDRCVHVCILDRNSSHIEIALWDNEFQEPWSYIDIVD